MRSQGMGRGRKRFGGGGEEVWRGRGRTHLMRQVGCPVQLGVSLNDVASLVGVPVDEGSNAWQLGNDVYGVLKVGLPVVELIDALGVGCCKLTARLHNIIQVGYRRTVVCAATMPAPVQAFQDGACSMPSKGARSKANLCQRWPDDRQWMCKLG